MLSTYSPSSQLTPRQQSTDAGGVRDTDQLLVPHEDITRSPSLGWNPQLIDRKTTDKDDIHSDTNWLADCPAAPVATQADRL